jgi:cytidyltransferase-like protein
MSAPRQVIVTGGFDDLRSRELRFLEEASRYGAVTVLLWTDAAIARKTGKTPKFPLAERQYLLEAVRYVAGVVCHDGLADPEALALPAGLRPDVWADLDSPFRPARQRFCDAHRLAHRVLSEADLKGFPEPAPMASAPGRKKVVATGCYDWFHSGHVRFTEEASAYGDLYVCLGSDKNVRLLKGEGHPWLCEAERRYVVGSIKFVKQALITTGEGWLDADPEIRRLQPDIYIVNEDGDKGGKREYCEKLGMEYVVLKRVPAAGLPQRSSTDLRGF